MMFATPRKLRHIYTLFALLLLFDGSYGDQHCTNVLPGIEKIVRGVDVSKMSLYDADELGYGRNVIELTCHKGKKYVNPHDNLEYDMPDQISSYITATGGILETTSHMWKSTKDVRKTFSMHFKVTLGFGPFSWSTSKSYVHASQTLTGRRHRMIDIQASVSCYHATFAPGELMGLNGEAGRAWSRLPEDIGDDPEAYSKFIRDYGTHYFVQGKFGGTIRTVFTLGEKLFDDQDTDKVTAQAEASYEDEFSAKLGFNLDSQGISEEFKANAKSETEYFGGEPGLAARDIEKWEPTVARHPWVLGGQLFPIYTMAGDTKKARNMKHAVDTYLGQGYLLELQRLVDAADTEWSLEKGMIPVHRDMMERWRSTLAEEKKKSIPDVDTVMKLGEEIEYQLIPPDWWDTTSFCIKFNTSVSEFFTRASSTSPICVQVDSFSPYLDLHPFRTRALEDVTVETGIFSPMADEWFHQLQWCRNIFNETSRKLGGKSITTTCVNINEFIEVEAKLGVRAVNWHLWPKVGGWPDLYINTPTWLQNVKVCIKFHIAIYRSPCYHVQNLEDERDIFKDETICYDIFDWNPGWLKFDTDLWYLPRTYPCVRSWGLITPRL